MTMYYVRKFSALGAADAAAFGVCGVNLGKMTRAGAAVAPGFCIGAETYQVFISRPQVQNTIVRVLSGLQMDDPEDLEVRTEQIRNFLNAQPIPTHIVEEILQAYFELGVDLGSNDTPVPVALFASPVSRDPDSLACTSPPSGLFLNVSGEAELLEQVKRCWGTIWTARAVACRVKRGVDHGSVALAVVVQAMVRAEALSRFWQSRAGPVDEHLN